MSGGAFNYVYQRAEFWLDYSILNSEDDLKGCEEHLRRIGCQEEADEVLKYRLALETIRHRVEVMGMRMSPLLKAAEWNASNDWGIDPIREAYNGLMDTRPPKLKE